MKLRRYAPTVVTGMLAVAVVASVMSGTAPREGIDEANPPATSAAPRNEAATPAVWLPDLTTLTPGSVLTSGAPAAADAPAADAPVADAPAAGPPVPAYAPAPANPPMIAEQPVIADPPVSTPGLVAGTVERLWAEATVDDGSSPLVGSGTRQTWLATGQQRYRVTPGPLDDVAPGSAVTATLGAGDDLRGHPLLALGDVEPPASAQVDGVTIGADTLLDFAALPSAVTHQITAVLAVPAGASADTTTIASFADRISGPVNGFWSAQSRGRRTIVVAAAHSWVPLTASCSGSPFTLWNEVAAKVGFISGPRKHLLVYLPSAAGCGAGLGTVGPTSESGGMMWTSYNSTDVIAHEFGHNLGLGHSSGLLCPATSDGGYSGGWAAGCAVHGYRDYYDVMGIGWGNVGSLTTLHADSLGFLSSSEKVTVTAPTRARLSPVSGDGLRALKIPDAGATYYVEYRPAVAADAWLTGNWRGLDPGVLVRRINPADSRESLLLDSSVTAGTRTGDWQFALGAGRTLTTATGRVAVTVESADGAGATIVVTVDGQAPAPPVGAPTDGSQVRFSAPADGARLAAGVTTFTGVATAPGGTLLWEVTQSGTVRASGFAAAGGEGTFDAFSFPVSLPAGSYTVRAWVPDESDGEGGPGRAGSASLNVTVS